MKPFDEDNKTGFKKKKKECNPFYVKCIKEHFIVIYVHSTTKK